MQLRSWTATALLVVGALADVNASTATHQVLSAYRPPQHWQNNNLVRSINLEKSYPREYVNVVIENISPEAQDEYYIPFDTIQSGSVGSVEVKDKKQAGAPFVVDLLGNDALRYVDLQSSSCCMLMVSQLYSNVSCPPTETSCTIRTANTHHLIRCPFRTGTTPYRNRAIR